MRPEQQGSHNSKIILHSGEGILQNICGTYSHSGMMDYTKFPISDMHLGKIPNSMKLKAGKLISRLKYEKYIKSVLDLFSIPNFYIRKGRPHGHRYGKKPGCKEYHTANQLQRRCRKKKYDNIHDRFIRDKFFRKTMIELGRSEEIILEMDQLASENHTHVATRAEIDVYRGNWWIRSNVVNFDTMPTRRQPDFKKALSTLYRLKKAEDKKHHENCSQSSSSWWQWQTNWWEPYYENSPQRWSEH